MKAPSTADFPYSDDAHDVERIGTGRFRVISYVDAQNGFGAQIRNNYICLVQTPDSGRTWYTEQVTLLDR